MKEPATLTSSGPDPSSRDRSTVPYGWDADLSHAIDCLLEAADLLKFAHRQHDARARIDAAASAIHDHVEKAHQAALPTEDASVVTDRASHGSRSVDRDVPAADIVP